MARNFVVGSSDNIQNAGIGILSTEPITMACFAVPLVDISVARTLISIGNPGGVSFFRLGLTATGPSVFCQKQDEGGISGTIGATGTIAVGTTYHCCAVFTANNSRTVYRDGANSASDATLVGGVTSARTSIGIQAGNLGTPRPMNGHISEVGIWSAALNTEEIAALAKGFSPILIRRNSLALYAPLIRDIIDYKGLALTASGTNIVDQNRMIGL